MRPIRYSPINRRVYTYLKETDYPLEPQARAILNIIKKYSPLNRYTLLHHMQAKIESVRDVGVILNNHDKLLAGLGAIKMEDYRVWKSEKEKKDEENDAAMIVPNNQGQFSLKIGNFPPFGSYVDVEAAKAVIERARARNIPLEQQVQAIAEGTV